MELKNKPGFENDFNQWRATKWPDTDFTGPGAVGYLARALDTYKPTKENIQSWWEYNTPEQKAMDVLSLLPIGPSKPAQGIKATAKEMLKDTTGSLKGDDWKKAFDLIPEARLDWSEVPGALPKQHVRIHPETDDDAIKALTGIREGRKKLESNMAEIEKELVENKLTPKQRERAEEGIARGQNTLNLLQTPEDLARVAANSPVTQSYVNISTHPLIRRQGDTRLPVDLQFDKVMEVTKDPEAAMHAIREGLKARQTVLPTIRNEDTLALDLRHKYYPGLPYDRVNNDMPATYASLYVPTARPFKIDPYGSDIFKHPDLFTTKNYAPDMRLKMMQVLDDIVKGNITDSDIHKMMERAFIPAYPTKLNREKIAEAMSKADIEGHGVINRPFNYNFVKQILEGVDPTKIDVSGPVVNAWTDVIGEPSIAHLLPKNEFGRPVFSLAGGRQPSYQIPRIKKK